MIGRRYLDPGDRLAGRYDPPRPSVVLPRCGVGGGPRNVPVHYHHHGTTAVVPFLAGSAGLHPTIKELTRWNPLT